MIAMQIAAAYYINNDRTTIFETDIQRRRQAAISYSAGGSAINPALILTHRMRSTA